MAQVGLSAALGGKFPETTVIFDHDFLSEPGNLHGFEQLYSGSYEGKIGWDRKGMWIGTENVATSIATAIKRLAYWDRFTRIKVEAWLSLNQWYGDNAIRSVEVGFDQANDAGQRNYFALRRVFAKSGGTATSRWDVKTGTDTAASYTPLPGQGFPVAPITGTDTEPDPSGGTPFPVWPQNEGKRNTVFLALEVDPVANQYLGAQFLDRKLGTLRDSGEIDPALQALQGQSSQLNRFANGFNTSIDLRALISGSRTAADLYCERIRVTGSKG